MAVVVNEIVQTDFEVEIQARIDAERARLRAQAGLARMREFKKPVERTFTAPERDYVTILFGGLTWKHEEMIKAVFHGSGYHCENIPTPEVADFQAGKEFGNNGQCNPTYFTVGNLVRYLQKLEQQGDDAPADHRQLRLLHRRLLRALPLRHVRSGVSLRAAECRLRGLPGAALPADRRHQGRQRRAGTEVLRRLRHGHAQCAQPGRRDQRAGLPGSSV